jgi:hypothetical protein
VLQVSVIWLYLIPTGLASGPYLRRAGIVETKTVVGDILDLDASKDGVIDKGCRMLDAKTREGIFGARTQVFQLVVEGHQFPEHTQRRLIRSF